MTAPVLIASFWSRQMNPLASVTWLNKEAYCYRHGYAMLWRHHEDGADIMWDRPRQWQRVLEEATDGTICLFLGCDTLFTSPESDLQSWFVPGFDAFVLVDHANVFGDCHAWKASALTRQFMKTIADRSHPHACNDGTEQEAFTSALADMPFREYQKLAGTDFGTPAFYERAQSLLSQGGLKTKLLNVTNFIGDDPEYWPPGDIPVHHAWTPAHLLLHMGGIPNDKRLERLPRYLFNKNK